MKASYLSNLEGPKHLMNRAIHSVFLLKIAFFDILCVDDFAILCLLLPDVEKRGVTLLCSGECNAAMVGLGAS